MADKGRSPAPRRLLGQWCRIHPGTEIFVPELPILTLPYGAIALPIQGYTRTCAVLSAPDVHGDRACIGWCIIGNDHANHMDIPIANVVRGACQQVWSAVISQVKRVARMVCLVVVKLRHTGRRIHSVPSGHR
jgi:hypothetical protein